VLMDSVNARGGSSAGGSCSMLSSTGQRLSSDPVTSGNYTLVSGVMGAVDTTAPMVSLSSPAASQVATGTVAAVGMAFDRNDVQWTLYLGPGSSPSEWTQIASGSGNQAGSYQFGSWDSSYYSGIYTFKIVAVDGHGNTAEGTVSFNVDYTITVSGSIASFEWFFIGLSELPDDSDPLSIFGPSGDYKVHRWDHDSESDEYIDKYRYPSTLSAGYGF